MRRRLGIWDALPPFNGGKRRLAGLIFGAIDRIVPRSSWPSLTFVDAFLGGGSVALYAKAQGFGKVIGIDIARRSAIVGQALIANSRVRLTKEDVIRVLAPRDGGPVERDLVPDVFTPSQARAIDGALSLAARTEDPARAALLKLLAIRIALLVHPFSYVRRGTMGKVASGEYERITPTALPQYLRGLRLATVAQLWNLAEKINRGVFEGCGEVRQGDALDLLPTIKADVLYADPPYAATRSYEAAYKTLNRLLGEESRPTSPFTARDGARMIDVLLERAQHIPVIVLSFGNETISLEDLEQKLALRGRATKAIEIPYSRLPALSKDDKKDRELLVVGWDPSHVGLDVADRLVEHPAIHASRDVQLGLEAPGPARSRPHAFANESLDEAQPGLLHDRALGPAIEVEVGRDDPHTLLAEGSVEEQEEGLPHTAAVSRSNKSQGDR